VILDLDPRSSTPLYRQIATSISGLIRQGLVAAGSRLPPTRELALAQGVSRNTVVLAYQELEIQGLVSSRVGSGTFVCRDLPGRLPLGASPATPGLSLENRLAGSWTIPHASLLAAMEKMSDPGADGEGLSFASAPPDPDLLPLAEFRQSLSSSFRRFGADLLELGSPAGFAPLLEYLRSYIARRGVICGPRELMVAGGMQQGLSLVARLFLDPGDTVLLENLTYPGALAVFRSLQASCVGIPLDDQGMRTDDLEGVLRRRSAKLLYTIPTFQNPPGSTLPPERRKRVVELCREHGVAIVEDDYAHELVFDGMEALPLKAWDEWGGTIYLGSFSESVFPGIRLCWIVAPEGIIDRLRILKQVSDLSSSPILQGALLEFLRMGHSERLLKRKRRAYRARRDAMAGAMERHFPREVLWVKPPGGLYQWVDLPPTIDAMELLAETRTRGVVFAPDRLFSVEEWRRGGFRLGFGDLTEDKIDEGARIIGESLKARLRRPGKGPPSQPKSLIEEV
jgi:GntR family transcriptional regulator